MPLCLPCTPCTEEGYLEFWTELFEAVAPNLSTIKVQLHFTLGFYLESIVEVLLYSTMKA